MVVQVDRVAPDFEMEGVFKGETKDYRLSDYRGKWAILFYYPLDFTFICPTEIKEFSKHHSDFEALNGQVLGISIDSIHSHMAWLKELGELNYPLLSDITKSTARTYGILLEDKGIALRGTFIINPEGVLKYHLVHDLDVGRSVKETLRVLKALQTGELCQVEWKPGEQTLGKG